MKKLIKTQLKKIDKTIKRLNKLFGEISYFANKSSENLQKVASSAKISSSVEPKHKAFSLARKKNSVKIKKQ